MKWLLIVWGLLFLYKQHVEVVTTKRQIESINVIKQFKSTLSDVGIACPDVVLAQIVLETDYLTSKIYRENNNLFGMKESRRDFDIGSQHGHANYPNWIASVRDYAAWQKVMGGSKIVNNEDYLYFLDHLPGNRRYAEDLRYTEKLRKIMTLL